MDLEDIRYRYYEREIFVLGQKAAGVKGFNTVQDYYTIQKQCLESGTLFEDPEFPPTGRWLRPKEICENPQVFVEKCSRFDVKQGRLGDCWFLSAVAPLTFDQESMDLVVCKDNSFDENYAGIFHFRFWLNGKWIDVVVDDRLPVNAYGQLENMKSSQTNEFWSALLEKAYAKIFGGYEALEGGSAYEAFEDFTGGISELYKLKSAPKNLYEIMEVAAKRGSLMAASIDPNPNIKEDRGPNGLPHGHVYSITKIKRIEIEGPNHNKIEVPLIRLRNPWGEGEWNGPWSDDSREWKQLTEEQHKELEITADEDGEFWMSYYDFVANFDGLDICNIAPNSLQDVKRKNYFWEEKVYHGAWIKGKSAGGCRNYLDNFHLNPQYVVELKNKDDTDPEGRCSLLIALVQKNGRTKVAGTEYVYIGFYVYRLEEDQLDQVPLGNFFFRYRGPAEKSTFTDARGATGRYKLAPGHYLIVPCTFDPNVEREFFLRVCSEKNEFFDEEEVKKFIEENKDKKRAYDYTPSFKPVSAKDFAALKDVTVADDSTPTENPPIIKDPHTNENQPIVKNPPIAKEPSTGSQTVEILFNLAAGSKKEIDWFQLKTILDGTIPNESRVKGPYADYKNDGFSRDTCRSIIAMMDNDYSRNLKLDEFKKFFALYTQWKNAFKKFNTTGSWKLAPQELMDALNSVGFNLNGRIINMLIYRYGTPYNTLLFEDFIMCAVKVTTMIERFKEKGRGNNTSAVFTRDDWVETTLYS